MQPLILAYSETNESNIANRIGMSEYSYYFVLKWFAPILAKLGELKIIRDPETEADAEFDLASRQGRVCILFSFAPPHRTLLPKRCPTVPLVAWEFERIPDYTWDNDPRNDWRFIFNKTGLTVTHSEFARQAILRVMPPSFPVWSIPAPVWDRFSARGTRLHGNTGREPVKGLDLHVKGVVFDSAEIIPRKPSPPNQVAPAEFKRLRRAARRKRSARKVVARLLGKTIDQYEYERLQASHHLQASGVVYASILNPQDHRKNWGDILTAFVSCFQDVEDAVLVLKLNEKNSIQTFGEIEHQLNKFTWMKCRVIAFNGYLQDEDYDYFLDGIDFVVNASTGEGQCLPLMELMSMGVPAIAPDHTSMADYLSADNALLLPYHRYIAGWPHDPRFAYTTHAYKVEWDALEKAYRQAYEIARHDTQTYRNMSKAAMTRLESHCSERVALNALNEILSPYCKKASAKAQAA